MMTTRKCRSPLRKIETLANYFPESISRILTMASEIDSKKRATISTTIPLVAAQRGRVAEAQAGKISIFSGTLPKCRMRSSKNMSVTACSILGPPRLVPPKPPNPRERAMRNIKIQGISQIFRQNQGHGVQKHKQRLEHKRSVSARLDLLLQPRRLLLNPQR